MSDPNRPEPQQEPSLGEQIRQLRPQLKALAALGEEIRSCAERLTTIITFAAHPDLTDLDDELDTLYRGQM